MNRALTLLGLSVCLLLGLTSHQSFAFGALDGGGPTVFGTNKLFVMPGDKVTFTVYLDGPSSGEDELSVSSVPGAFLDLPTTVTPAAGATSVSFDATAGSSATTGVIVTISNGVVTIPAPLLMFATGTPLGL